MLTVDVIQTYISKMFDNDEAQYNTMDEEVKLLGSWVSPFVLRVEWVLKLKGIQYEYVEEDLINKSPLLLKYNPIHKKVPVLVHAGKPIAESIPIIEYLDDTWKQNPILPQDPYQRSIARFWSNFIDQKLFEAMRSLLFTQGEEQENNAKQAIETFDVIEGELIGKKFFGGDAIGLPDIVLGWMCSWLGVMEEIGCKKVFDPTKYPSIVKWMENFMDVPVVKESMPSSDELMEYFRKIRPLVIALAAKK